MQTTMCLSWARHKLGCAYYSDQTLELYLMEDMTESDQFENVLTLIAQISPSLLFLSDKQDLQAFIKHHYGNTIEIKTILAKDMAFEKGRYMLLNWFIHHIQQDNIYLRDPEEGNKTHAYLQLEGLVQLDDSLLSVACAGVVLKHIQQDESFQPNSIKAFTCQDCMHINSDTQRSLCIFDLETHPNMHQQHREKESLSLFGLLNKTKSALGKHMLKDWVARPTQNRKVIEQRQRVIQFLMQSDMREQIVELGSHLKHIKNIHQLLSRVRESKATLNDWQYILKFAYYSICIFNLLQQWIQHKNELSKEIVLFQKIKQMLPMINTVMEQVGSYINHVIDFETSKQEARVIVKEGVDTTLDDLREKYQHLDDYLLQVSQEISTVLPMSLRVALNVVYFPQLGYLITLPQYHLQRHSSAVDDNGSMSSINSELHRQRLAGFELQFTTADNLYYKNERTKELDESLGDIHAMIVDKEIEIIQSLSEKILEHTLTCTDVVQVLSELDCLVSLALVALKFNYVRPTMTDDNRLDIIQGRHPLQELCVNIFIPNDTHLQGGKGCLNHKEKLSNIYHATTERRESHSIAPTESDSAANVDSVQIVTGANFSGKSVYLKQIALIVYMAHIGSFVPAEKATIGITDKMFTRIQTSETVSKPQSAFGFDLQQLNRALSNATCRSLVVMDEFGKVS
ncbi:DNA mismatch repair protein MutS [Gilbertella persicaria]|uniref:DNA mismatch repair protein MutS n=1 Tax=Gilbertella persicaria TaxID=101096 RepID=UPI002220FE3A|nr:DNA mismatch repair protein MutS [Gilbertella persicaria]KAI8049134.1 DNA mismatch repair protein MutS [Gilbertella persicaria]